MMSKEVDERLESFKKKLAPRSQRAREGIKKRVRRRMQ